MKFIDIINVGILNIKQHKLLNLIMFISFFTCFNIILIYLCIENSFYKYSSENKNLIKNRTIEFCYNEDMQIESIISKIEGFEHVQLVTKDIRLQGKYKEALVMFEPTNDEILNNKDIIIPEKIYLNENDYIDGKKLVGNRIKIEHAYKQYIQGQYIEEEGIYFSGTRDMGEEECEYNVISTYSENIEKDKNIFFISKDSLIKLEKKFCANAEKEKKIEVVVDDYDNLLFVWENILENGLVDIKEQQSQKMVSKENIRNIPIRMDIYSYIGISSNIVKIYKHISILLISVSTVILIISLTALNIIQIIDNKYQIGVLRVQGYLNKYIKRIFYIQNISILFFSYITSVIINIFVKNNFNNIVMKNDLYIYLIPFIISIIISYIVFSISYKILEKQNIIELLKEK